MKPPRLAVFASGGGSNFQAIVDAVADGRLDVDVSVLVASTPSAGALDRARNAGILCAVCGRDDDPLAIVEPYDVDIVALAGYMRLIPASFIHAYKDRIVNIHPSLLPAFGGHGMYGMRVHEAVVAHGVRITGATVHLVDTSYDTGPIVAQEAVPVHSNDTAEQVAARVLAVEHALYPRALQLLATDRLLVSGRTVSILPPISDP